MNQTATIIETVITPTIIETAEQAIIMVTQAEVLEALLTEENCYRV